MYVRALLSCTKTKRKTSSCNIYVHTQRQTHARARTRTHKSTHTRIHTYTHARERMYTHASTRTHTSASNSSTSGANLGVDLSESVGLVLTGAECDATKDSPCNTSGASDEWSRCASCKCHMYVYVCMWLCMSQCVWVRVCVAVRVSW